MDTGSALGRLVEWLRAGGAEMGAIEVRESAEAGGGYGVFVRKEASVAASVQHAQIPAALVISASKCRAALGDTELRGRALLSAFLLHVRFGDGGSFWKPYVDALPRTFHTPLDFSAAELRVLQGTPLDEAAVAERRAQFMAEFAKVASDTGAVAAIPPAGLTEEAYLWAATVVSSRAFTGSLAPQGEGDDETGVLLPLLDMINHRPSVRVAWVSDEHGSVGFACGNAMAGGDEVLNNYGAKANDELLMGYGFCVKDNPTNHFPIRLNYARDPQYDAKRALLVAASVTAEEFHIRRHALPSGLLPALRVMAMAEPDVCLAGREQSAGLDDLGLRIELRARFLLSFLLGQKLQRLEDSKASLEAKDSKASLEAEDNKASLEAEDNKASLEAEDKDPQCAEITANTALALQYRSESEDVLRVTLARLCAEESALMASAATMFASNSHALPSYICDGGVEVERLLAGDLEEQPERSAKRARHTSADESGSSETGEDPPSAALRFVETVLLTQYSVAEHDAEFAEAMDQVDVDDDVQLSLLLLRILSRPQSPWHTAVQRVAPYQHPMMLADCAEAFGEMLMEMGEIHDSLFPLLSDHFPSVFEPSAYSAEKFLWAAGVVESFRLSVPARCLPPGSEDVEGLLLV